MEDIFADDPGHPIPLVGVCDINGIRKGGGADLVIIIAAPLENDELSRRRLVQKIRNYLGLIVSEEFIRECGVSTPESTSIVVQVHPESDAKALGFLESCREWIYDNQVGFVVTKLAQTT